MSVFLSVITPTFNRKHTIHRVWDSLNLQEARIFEWFVVDDGSTDGTGQLINAWKSCSSFPIRYEYIKHRGLVGALNYAKSRVLGNFVTIMDSDDAYLANAMAIISECIENHVTSKSPAPAGIAFPYLDERDNRLCPNFPKDHIICSYLDSYFVHRMRGEILYVHKKEQYNNMDYIELPLPDHLPQSLARARRNPTYVYINRVIGCRYRHDGEGRIAIKDSNDITEIDKKSPKVKFVKAANALNYCIKYFKYDPIFFWKNSIKAIENGLYFGLSLSGLLNLIVPRGAKVLCLAVLPLGAVCFVILLLKKGKKNRKWDPSSVM